MTGHLALPLLASVLTSFGVCFAAALALSTAHTPMADAFRGHRRILDGDLRFVRSRLDAQRVLALQASTCAGLLALALTKEWWLLLTFCPLVLVLPRALLGKKRAERVTAIDAQVDTWLVILANALRATPSLGEAIASSARLVPAPMCEELDLVLNEYQLGAPLDVALRTMSDRLRSRTINVALGTLRIARNTGGNLPETLEISAAALREIARLEGVVRTKTAEGKAQATVIAVIPFPMIGILNYLNPSLLAPLWTTLTGYMLLAVAFMLWLVAILWARKILAVDV